MVKKEKTWFLDKFSGYKRKGFYVDIGANDPHMFSNTKRFYLRGWTGINIEPNVDNWQKLSSYRKRLIGQYHYYLNKINETFFA
ncbi:MAG: hypothetical protein ACYDIA_04500 [Candidatus Humimicrobiaceae bacterium]